MFGCLGAGVYLWACIGVYVWAYLEGGGSRPLCGAWVPPTVRGVVRVEQIEDGAVVAAHVQREPADHAELLQVVQLQLALQHGIGGGGARGGGSASARRGKGSGCVACVTGNGSGNGRGNDGGGGDASGRACEICGQRWRRCNARMSRW